MSQRAPEQDDPYLDDDYDDDRDCWECGGDGFVEGADMNDPLWYDEDEFYDCPNCGGSGDAADCTYW